MKKKIEAVNEKWVNIVGGLSNMDFRELWESDFPNPTTAYNPMKDYEDEIKAILKDVEDYKFVCVDHDYYADADGFFMDYVIVWIENGKLELVSQRFETWY